VAPLAANLIESWPKATYASAGLGFILTLLSNGRVVLLSKTLLDSLFPESGGSSVRHTIQAAVGLLLIVGPTAFSLLKTWPHMTYICAGLGFITTLLSNPRFVLLSKTLLDLFYPEKSAVEAVPTSSDPPRS
jgi:hypothetical protein